MSCRAGLGQLRRSSRDEPTKFTSRITMLSRNRDELQGAATGRWRRLRSRAAIYGKAIPMPDCQPHRLPMATRPAVIPPAGLLGGSRRRLGSARSPGGRLGFLPPRRDDAPAVQPEGVDAERRRRWDTQTLAAVAASSGGRMRWSRVISSSRRTAVVGALVEAAKKAPQPVSAPTTIARTTRRSCSESSGARTDHLAHRGIARQHREAWVGPASGDAKGRSSAITPARHRPRRAGRPARRPRWGGSHRSASGRGRRSRWPPRS